MAAHRTAEEKQLEIVQALVPLVHREELITMVLSLPMLGNRLQVTADNDQMPAVQAGIEALVRQELTSLRIPAEGDLAPMLTTISPDQTRMVKQALVGYIARAKMYLEGGMNDALENALVKFRR